MIFRMEHLDAVINGSKIINDITFGNDNHMYLATDFGYVAINDQNMTVDVFKIRYAVVKGSRFDTAAFKKTHADLYAQYTRQTETRRFTVA